MSKTSDDLHKEPLRGVLSSHDSSLEGLMAKLGIAWVGYFIGLSLQEFLTLALTFASLVYVLFNTFVLVRDQVLRKRKLDAQADLNKQ